MHSERDQSAWTLEENTMESAQVCGSIQLTVVQWLDRIGFSTAIKELHESRWGERLWKQCKKAAVVKDWD